MNPLRILLALAPGWVAVALLVPVILHEYVSATTYDWPPVLLRMAGLAALLALFFKWNPPLKPGDIPAH